MLGHLGFSYIGLIYLLVLFVPNIVWTKKQPEGYVELAKNENKILVAFERIGQVLVVVTAVIFSDYNLNGFYGWTAWLIASSALMLLYNAAWIRYFIKPTLKNFYGSFLFIPIPLASLPVFAFLLLGIYGKVIWLIVSAVIIGIGHMGIHIQHLKEIKKMSELTRLPNIGTEMERQLNKIGITTIEQLKETGSKKAWLKILAIDSSACYNRLCGLEGAIHGIRWHYLPDEIKKELKEFYNKVKKGS